MDRSPLVSKLFPNLLKKIPKMLMSPVCSLNDLRFQHFTSKFLKNQATAIRMRYMYFLPQHCVPICHKCFTRSVPSHTKVMHVTAEETD